MKKSFKYLVAIFILFFSCSFFSLLEAQVVVYDYIKINYSSAHFKLSETGKEQLTHHFTKEERRRGADAVVLELIKEKNKEGWELFSTTTNVIKDSYAYMLYVYHLRRIDKDATEAANK